MCDALFLCLLVHFCGYKMLLTADVMDSEIEIRLRERFSNGLDANDLMEVALLALKERDNVCEAINAGWLQADAGEFVKTSPQSVIWWSHPSGYTDKSMKRAAASRVHTC